MNRQHNLNRLRHESFDICVIGAGASGAGAALDAALRGYRVALIDKGDIAGETSSRSTKLIHGGVRYLEQAVKNLDLAQLRQVRHGLAERRTVLRNAPHLAHPLALLTPVFSWFEAVYITIGLTLYDFFASHDSFPKGRWLSREKALAKMPTLTPRLHSAVLYYDGQFDDARYALALAHSADEAGAAVANYVAVRGFAHDHTGRLVSADVEDQLSGETITIQAKLFLNCTGPYADSIRHLANPLLESRIRPSKGVHIVLPRSVLQSDSAMLIPKTADGRVVFAIPFGDKVFVGTTDDDYTDLNREPVLEPKEVDYLLETLRPYLAKTPDRSEVEAGFGGIRPLITSNRATTKTLLRDHEVEHDSRSNLLSLLGGKWTTYRLMAQDAIDRAGELLDTNVSCSTATHCLVGGEGYQFENWQQLQSQYNLPADVARHLVKTYGTRAERVAELSRSQPGLAERLAGNLLPSNSLIQSSRVRSDGTSDQSAPQIMRHLPGADGTSDQSAAPHSLPFIAAEVVYQVREEMAVTLRDVLARRWRLELADWQLTSDLAPQVADLMAAELGWTEAHCQEEVETYQHLLASFVQQAGLTSAPSKVATV